jgi:hypothetical protein
VENHQLTRRKVNTVSSLPPIKRRTLYSRLLKISVPATMASQQQLLIQPKEATHLSCQALPLKEMALECLLIIREVALYFIPLLLLNFREAMPHHSVAIKMERLHYLCLYLVLVARGTAL